MPDTPDTAGNCDGRGYDLPDDIAAIAGSPTRYAIVAALVAAGGEMDVRSLADEVASATDAISDDDESVAVALMHVHLPRLDDDGVIERSESDGSGGSNGGIIRLANKDRVSMIVDSLDRLATESRNPTVRGNHDEAE